MNDLIKNALQIGAQQQNQGEFRDAEQTYIEALKTHSDDASLNYNLALLLIEMAEHKRALRYVKNSLRSDPSRLECWLTYVDLLIE